ncbi:MAG: tetratricopeptide repeat protein, partial [Gemmatimonadales bacterium]|nr:tetratricopeptide repeat protein [Gemmatimonadales bacterium]
DDQRAGRLGDAIDGQREAVSIARSIHMQEQGVAALLVAETLRNLATLVWNRDRSTESIALASEAAHVFDSVPASVFEEDPFEIVQAQATAMWTLGIILAEVANEFGKALEVTSVAVTKLRATQNGERHPKDALALALHNLGVRLTECGMLDDAMAVKYESLELTEELARTHPQTYATRLASCLVNLANSLILAGDPRSALEVAARAHALRESALSDIQSEEHTRDFARALQTLGRAHWAAGEYVEARDVLQQAVSIFRMLAETNPATCVELDYAAYELAEVSEGRKVVLTGGADRRFFDPSLLSADMVADSCPDDLRHLLTTIDSASAAVHRGDCDGARQLYDHVESELAARGQSSAESYAPNVELDAKRVGLLLQLAERLDGAGDANGATELRERSLELLRAHSGNVDQLKSSHAGLAHNLAVTKQGLGEYESALVLAKEAVGVRRKLVETRLPELVGLHRGSDARLCW